MYQKFKYIYKNRFIKVFKNPSETNMNTSTYTAINSVLYITVFTVCL